MKRCGACKNCLIFNKEQAVRLAEISEATPQKPLQGLQLWRAQDHYEDLLISWRTRCIVLSVLHPCTSLDRSETR
jgi:hypothetical protein